MTKNCDITGTLTPLVGMRPCEQDDAGLAEAAHGLKGICANIGATQLHHIAINIEQTLRAGKKLDSEETTKSLEIALAQITNHLVTIQAPQQ